MSSFEFGKKGRRLSKGEQLVRRLMTWHRKTLAAALRNHGVNPDQFTTRNDMIVALAYQILRKHAEDQHELSG